MALLEGDRGPIGPFWLESGSPSALCRTASPMPCINICQMPPVLHMLQKEGKLRGGGRRGLGRMHARIVMQGLGGVRQVGAGILVSTAVKAVGNTSTRLYMHPIDKSVVLTRVIHLLLMNGVWGFGPGALAASSCEKFASRWLKVVCSEVRHAELDTLPVRINTPDYRYSAVWRCSEVILPRKFAPVSAVSQAGR